MSANILSCFELNTVLEIIHSLISCSDVDQFKQLANSFMEFIGFNHMIFGMPGPDSFGGRSVRDLNISYPKEWVDLYQANEFWRIDPVVLAVMESCSVLHWTDIYKRFPPEKKFLRLAGDFGLKHGYSCLMRGRTGHSWSIISIAGDFKKHTDIVNYVLARVAPHFHLALSELKSTGEATKLQSLTKKEKEVLCWLHQGKTSWEISIILKVSEATVNFHVKNIKTKLNAVNRSQAVATSIHCKLVNL
ncbi:MAG: autoinducer binding domain-containing protein [Desulfurivibrionaceae bacterium]|nr:autoinducer binding domain-containing protein [Desulfurivibrionaceae bacterium]